MNARAIQLGRLYAMRENLDAVIDALEQEELPSTPACDHPERMRKYHGDTMGGDMSFTCEQCQTVVRAVPSPDQILTRVVRPGSPPQGA